MLSLLFFLPRSGYSQAKSQAAPPDVPSGFAPGLMTYFAGDGSNDSNQYSDGSIPTQVEISPNYVVSDSKGNTYLASSDGTFYIVYRGGQIPKVLMNITTSPVIGAIYQIAGLVDHSCETDPDNTCGEGKPFNRATFSSIGGLAIDGSDNLYYSDGPDLISGFVSNVVRKVDAATSLVTTVAGKVGRPPSFTTDIGDGGLATNASLNGPTDLKVDAFGNVFFNDLYNDVIRVVYSGSSPPPVLAAEGVTVTAAQAGFIYSVAGQPLGYCTEVGACLDGTSATTSAILANEESMAIDAAGNIYIADTFPSLHAAYIRVVYAGGEVPAMLQAALNPEGGNGVSPRNGYIYAVTGYGLASPLATCGKSPCGDGGLAATMQFGATEDGTSTLYTVVDRGGNLYVADQPGSNVRKIDSAGYASTVAGIDDPRQKPPNPSPAPSGGRATETQLLGPTGIAFDPQGNLYIADTNLVWEAEAVQAQTIDFPAPAPVIYGGAAITLTATASSGLPVVFAVTTGPAHVSGVQLIVTGAGTVVITATQAGDAQYAPAPPVSQSLAVNPAALTVTANNASKVFNKPNPAFTAVFSGFVTAEDNPGNSVTGKAAFSTTATTTSPVGTYPVTIAQGTLASSKYTFVFVQGATLTVTGNTAQTISFAAPSSIVYGQAPTVTLTATASSQLPVRFTIVSGPATNVDGGATLTITGGGTITVTARQNGNSVYTAAPPITQKLVVNPASLTVTGPQLTLPFGVSVDTGTFPAAAITGFVGNDNASLLVGHPKYATAKGKPKPGTYPITVTKGSLAVLNSAKASYVLGTFADGLLTVSPSAQTITLNPLPASQTYGYPATLTAVASSGLPVTFTATGGVAFTNGNVTDPLSNATSVPAQFTAVGTVTVTAAQAGDASYTAAAPVSLTFDVGKAPLQILAEKKIREQGAQNPVFTYIVGVPPTSGFVNGDADVPAVITGLPDVTTVATPDSPPGAYDIVVGPGTLAAPNYYFVLTKSTLTVTPPGSFGITASPASLTIPNGQSGQATLTITPTNAYQGTVTLSCGALPANVGCAVSPSTYTFPGSQNADGSENLAQGTITISASNRTIVGADAAYDPISRAATLVVPGLLGGLLLTSRRRRTARYSKGIWALVTLLALGAGTLGITACGGSSKPGVPGSGTGALIIMIIGSGTSVTSSDAVVTSSAPLNVTIQ